MKRFFQFFAVGLTGVLIAITLVAVGTIFFEELGSQGIMTQWILDVAGWTILPVAALTAIGWCFAYPR